MLPRRARLPLVVLLLLVLGPLAAAEPSVNGTLTTLGEGEDAVSLLKVWGTPYEMGYAQGKLGGERIRKFYRKVLFLMSLGLGGTAKVDAAWAQMEPFVSDRMKEELKGLADGSGIALRDVERCHAIPDLSEFHCTFFAAWGSATADGHLHQIRALDYATQAGLQDEPALVVYQPTGKHRFVNVGWLGFLGAVTGMNDQHVALSEIGDHFGDDVETLAGEPMPFLMRRVLEEADGLDSAISIFKTAHRTSSYLYCIGDSKLPAARALRTSKDFCEVYGPDDHGDMNLKDLVFWSMGTDSQWNRKVYDTLQPKLGKIDDQTGMRDVMKGLRTGNLHAVEFDVTNLELWVSNATPAPNIQPAYDQQFVHFQLK
ncbi:MAG: hypothetical protein HYU66_18125 [Armatimonadetes bacterium]|nr:hypothetical protein [Armatimonadota bacterium]